jgi:dolichol-phosphate mannosyltransferase
MLAVAKPVLLAGSGLDSANGVWAGAIAFALLLIQLPATFILLSRLLQGPARRPPLQPQDATLELLGQVSIVVPTLNEAERIGPCLAGLTRQGYEVREMIVVDSHSQDGTGDLVKLAQQKDPRFRLISDDPLPPGWVGRPWALHTGFLHSSDQSTWVLGIDADTQPQPGLVASVITAAAEEGYDLVSVSPQFILKDPGELWLQPALLVTLIYRFGAAGAEISNPERILANGQCFLCRRSLLAAIGGYTSARSSFCDDVTLARYAAQQGAKVGFFDGSQVIKVRMYEGARETWEEWGRSLDLKDASSIAQTWGDLGFLLAVQGLPLVLTIALLGLLLMGYTNPVVIAALGLNAVLLFIRFALLWGIASTYDRVATTTFWTFWLSPLADPLAVLRIFLSSIQTPKRWRGRVYS